MTQVKRLVSSALLGLGVLLVFTGFSAALDFTFFGMLASLAAIATLLYAGAVWASAAVAPPRASPDSILVFDRSLRVACGRACGSHVATQFPESMRREIEARCSAALLGHPAQFTCERDGVAIGFDATPVRTADGTIPYGILITGTAAPASAVAACIAS